MLARVCAGGAHEAQLAFSPDLAVGRRFVIRLRYSEHSERSHPLVLEVVSHVPLHNYMVLGASDAEDAVARPDPVPAGFTTATDAAFFYPRVNFPPIPAGYTPAGTAFYGRPPRVGPAAAVVDRDHADDGDGDGDESQSAGGTGSSSITSVPDSPPRTGDETEGDEAVMVAPSADNTLPEVAHRFPEHAGVDFEGRRLYLVDGAALQAPSGYTAAGVPYYYPSELLGMVVKRRSVALEALAFL